MNSSLYIFTVYEKVILRKSHFDFKHCIALNAKGTGLLNQKARLFLIKINRSNLAYSWMWEAITKWSFSFYRGAPLMNISIKIYWDSLFRSWWTPSRWSAGQWTAARSTRRQTPPRRARAVSWIQRPEKMFFIFFFFLIVGQRHFDESKWISGFYQE